MAKLISLRPYHMNTQHIAHPLLDGAISYNGDEIDMLADELRENPEVREEFIKAFRSSLRTIVGRYVYHWPTSYPFEDEMVSEGFSVICEISLDLPSECGILKIVTRRIQDRINTFLNKNQALSAPSLRKQKYLQSEGEEPIYHNNTSVEIPEPSHPTDEGDEWKRDILDVLRSIETSDEIDAALLSRENWGRGYQELADDLGVGVGTIHRRKAILYEKFLELTR